MDRYKVGGICVIISHCVQLNHITCITTTKSQFDLIIWSQNQ